MRPGVLDGVAAQCGAHDLDVFTRTGERAVNGTPCHPSLTWGPDTPRPSRKRPPDIVSIVAAVIPVIAGVRAGICITADPRWIRSVSAPIHASIEGASEP